MTPVRQGAHSQDNDAADPFCPQVASTSRPNNQLLRFQESNVLIVQPGQLGRGADSQGLILHQDPNVKGNFTSLQPWQPQCTNQDNMIPWASNWACYYEGNQSYENFM